MHTCSLFGILGLEPIEEEDEELAGGVDLAHQLEDVAHIASYVVFSVTHLAT
jgi:hypothetical protein